jgi:hypothetical protein
MRKPVTIENIEDMRRKQGIDDVELREAVRRLQVGDSVRLTLLTGAESPTGETLWVRIRRICGGAFQGELAQKPTSAGLSKLRTGARVDFSSVHIHSVA